jgi:hypothetical protein
VALQIRNVYGEAQSKISITKDYIAVRTSPSLLPISVYQPIAAVPTTPGKRPHPKVLKGIHDADYPTQFCRLLGESFMYQ